MLSIFSKDKLTNNKKIIENLVLILLLFIIVIVVMNVLSPSTKNNNSDVQDTVNFVPKNDFIQTTKEDTMESKIANILSLVKGAGKVEVLITYKNGIEQVPMYNTKENISVIEEQDTAGGQRKTEETTNEKNIVFSENGNVKTPVIKQTINPEIIGIIIVSEGASNLSVKENLINATLAILDIPAHRVQVLAMK